MKWNKWVGVKFPAVSGHAQGVIAAEHIKISEKSCKIIRTTTFCKFKEAKN